MDLSLKFYNPYYEFYDQGRRWFKSGFHIHATPEETDNSVSIEKALEIYKGAGYDVAMISGQSDYYDTTKLGEKYGIKTINGEEYIGQDGILLIGTQEFIDGTPQEAVDACNRQGGVAVIAHPNWISHFETIPALSAQVRSQLKGYIGIEIVTPCIFDRFKGAGEATDVWDEMLSHGNAVWGFANDDFHAYHDAARAWTMICAKSDSFEDLKEAMLAGSLYASTGLVLKDFVFDGKSLYVTCKYRFFEDDSILYTAIGKGGKILQEGRGREITYQIQGNEEYVRIEAVGKSGAKLWCQPILNKEAFHWQNRQIGTQEAE